MAEQSRIPQSELEDLIALDEEREEERAEELRRRLREPAFWAGSDYEDP